MEQRIDFVIAWVDGGDPEWRKEFLRWMKPRALQCAEEGDADARDDMDASEERYRDWDNLRYWFRGVGKFAPWVNRIHFLTWGHLPEWLDTSDPRLNIVKHADFIPAEYLPTFSSAPIELNMHRIEGLSETFVYFNDDMFLCRPVRPDRFFRNGLPRDFARLSVIRSERIDHNALECLRIINRRHRKHGTIFNHARKWFNFRYPAGDMFKTMTLLPWSFFPGFRERHMPQPFLRSTFETLWREERGDLDATCRHRFRTLNDLLPWLMHYEQLVTGKFIPHGFRDTLLRQVSEENAAETAAALRSGRYSMVCLNDNGAIGDFAGVKKVINEAFESILPEKCPFEK